jgi:hypothetical protein
MKSLFTPSLSNLSISYLSLSNPPSPNPPSGLLGQCDYKNIKNSSADFCGKVGKSERAGQKVEGFYILYRYGDFTLYFLSRSFAEMRDTMKNYLTA